MSDGSSDASPYKAAQENIRDTIKWLAAAFGSLAAVVVGGTQFSGIGAIPATSGLFLLAAATLLLGFVCVAIALYRTLRLLRSDGLYISDLLLSSLETSGDEALLEVRTEINTHYRDWLPYNYPTIELLLEASNKEQEAMYLAVEKRDQDALKLHQQIFDALDVSIGRVLDFALYSRMYYRLQNELPRLFLISTLALLSLLGFAVVIARTKGEDGAEKASGSTIIEYSPAATGGTQPGPEPGPDLAAVKFQTGHAEIDQDGLTATAAARDYLHDHPDAVVLLLAHTDTMGPPTINEPLARQRGEAVRTLLLDPGGIAANRVFVAELPEHALPTVTPEQTADDRNRSVEFVITTPVFKKP